MSAPSGTTNPRVEPARFVWRRSGIAFRLSVTMLLVSLISIAVPLVLTVFITSQRFQLSKQDELEIRTFFEQLQTRGDLGSEVGTAALVLRPLGSTEPFLLPLPRRLAEDFVASSNRLGDPRPWLMRTLAFGSVLAVGLALLLAFLLSRRLAQPVQAVSQAASEMMMGKLSARVPITPILERAGDETSTLARTFNQMADVLERQEQHRRNMVADIAHELRTPISVMRAKLEALEDGVMPLTLEEVGRLQRQTGLLARLVDDLRLLSLADAGQLGMELRSVDLGTISRNVVSAFEPRASVKHVTVHLKQANEPSTLRADPDRLEQVLTNLLENALQHTPEGGTITVQLSANAESVQWHVLDTGPGLPQDALEIVFNRFYRTDASRSRLTGGSGLGLSIVRAIVELHGGTVTASNRITGGAEFVVSLPKR